MRALLSQGLSELGLDVSRAETLERFSSLLLEKNQVMNLTAITEPDAVAQLHLLDSAALLPFVDLTGKTVIDVGTGAGFPGMPLRILEDDFDLTLLDSLGKRVNWLQEVCDELQLKRVACVHARAEEFAMQHREQFDIATSRAVAQLSILSELCLPLIKVGGQFIAMKSVDTEDEIAAAILALMENQKLVAEGAGATPVAAALFGKLPLAGKKTVCLISGGNIDVNILSRVITRGLVMSGRKTNLMIALEDKPGQLSLVSDIVSACGANVVSVHHDRSDANMAITSCFLKLGLETRDAAQIETIKQKLTEAGFKLVTERA